MMTIQAIAGSEVAALPRALIIDGRLYFYALLQTDWDDSLYRRGRSYPLYSNYNSLVKDLHCDLIPCWTESKGTIDLDAARTVVGAGMADHEIRTVLVAWNGLEELAEGLRVPLNYRGRLATRSYQKLFWGLNPPSLTPPGARYLPVWRRKEISKIFGVLRSGSMRVARSILEAGVVGQSVAALDASWLE